MCMIRNFWKLVDGTKLNDDLKHIVFVASVMLLLTICAGIVSVIAQKVLPVLILGALCTGYFGGLILLMNVDS